MPNDAQFYAASETPVNRHAFDPWVAMGHVEARVKAKYGDKAGGVLSALREAETARIAARPLTRYTLNPDTFKRNLRALAYIADGRMASPAPSAIRQLYTDALADLTTIYPADKHHGGVCPFEVWKNLLDSTRDEALAGTDRHSYEGKISSTKAAWDKENAGSEAAKEMASKTKHPSGPEKFNPKDYASGVASEATNRASERHTKASHEFAAEAHDRAAKENPGRGEYHKRMAGVHRDEAGMFS